ncbi:hypothetical protein ACJX0J_020276, partial [Zea mays]
PYSWANKLNVFLFFLWDRISESLELAEQSFVWISSSKLLHKSVVDTVTLSP